MTIATPLVMTYPLKMFSTVGREDQNIARSIKEAILIRVSDTSLNRNIGKYQLPYILDEVLVKSPALKLKKQPHNIWALVTYLLLPNFWLCNIMNYNYKYNKK